jgi:uncharacterized delta-60 repeat protein
MKQFLLVFFAVFCVQTLIFAQNAGDLDQTFNYGMGNNYQFNFGTGADNSVSKTVIQSDGKILIVGTFTTYNGINRNGIARLNSDGSLDTSFNPRTGTNNFISTIALQSDGKILIGGDFTAFNGTVRNHIARLNTDGSLDASFNPGGTGATGSTGLNSYVSLITYQSDGKILISGDFTYYNGTSRNRIARLNVDGSLDASFNPGTGANNNVNSIALLSNGKILISGGFKTYNRISRKYVAKLNLDGSLDTSFNLDGIGITGATGTSISVSSLRVQSDNKSTTVR